MLHFEMREIIDSQQKQIDELKRRNDSYFKAHLKSMSILETLIEEVDVLKKRQSPESYNSQ